VPRPPLCAVLLHSSYAIAMAPAKRPATSTAGAAAKKAKGPPVGKICKDVASALKSSSLPPHVSTMLSQAMPGCLGACKEERHEFQARVVEMASEAMASVEADLQAKITAAEEKLASADAEKTSREAAVEATKKAAEEKSGLTEAAKKEAEAAAEELKKASEAVKAAEHEQKAGDQKFTQAEAKKEKLQSAVTSVFIPCKDGTVEAAGKAKAIQEITKLGRAEGFDTALLTSLPSALEKEPSNRGTFDSVVVKQVEDELQKRLDQLAETLAAAAPEREERAQKVSAAAAGLEAAKIKDASAKEAAKAAVDAQKAAVVEEKAAAKALKGFGGEMKSTAAELKDTKEALEEFKSGVLADFTQLVERSNVVPEPAPEEPEAAPAEAAAEAEPAA